MGQKTNPTGLRVAVTKDWRSKWYAQKKDFGKLLAEEFVGNDDMVGATETLGHEVAQAPAHRIADEIPDASSTASRYLTNTPKSASVSNGIGMPGSPGREAVTTLYSRASA